MRRVVLLSLASFAVGCGTEGALEIDGADSETASPASNDPVPRSPAPSGTVAAPVTAPSSPAPGATVAAPVSRAGAAYDPQRDGFVVHEWGTFTSVSGSDGTLLPGLHHEEEDLPPFVADRLKQAAADPANPGFVLKALTQKLETPVTYFYAPAPLQVNVSASFPRGFFSQWYPFVQKMNPPIWDIAPSMASRDLQDRWFQSPDSIPLQCRPRFAGEMQNGLLDWGTVKVLARELTPAVPRPPPATTWGFARNTAANPVEITAPGGGVQREKFLFYRGLGQLDLPLAVRFDAAGAPTFQNRDTTHALGGLVLMTVTKQAAGFRVLGDLPAGATLASSVPEATTTLPAFVEALRAALAARLEADGLYADEALAMVDTWERSYFLTPGVRALYLLPQPTTDRILPLAVRPAPAALKRTMVIRVEILPPAFELELAAEARLLASSAPTAASAARAYFLGHGRFAEPYLTRALALVPDAARSAAAQQALTDIRARRRWNAVTAE